MSRRTVSFFNTAISFVTIATMVLALVPAFPQITNAAGTVLFTDSFETEPAFSSPAWTADAQWGTTASNAHTGSRKARVLGHASSTDTLETTIDTSGYENISLAFWYKLDDLDEGDSVVVEWFDGSVWNEVVSFDGQSGDGDDSVDWIVSSSTLPAGAEDNASFAIRFTSNLDTGSDQFLLDDVTIEGDEISAPIDTVPPPTRPSLSGEVIYDAVPAVLPSSFPSQGYEATQTYEFGDKITFDGSSRQLDKVAITLTSWACETGGWNTADCETTPGSTFSHPITLNLYEVANDGTVGDEIASITQTFDIPYRPSANPACSDAKQWMDTNEDCFNGYNHVVVFDLSGVSVPDTIIYGVAYNTSHYGETPIGGANGPYDSLNVGLNTDEPAPYVGTDVDNDEVFWDTTYSGYTRGFKADSDWAPYKVAAIFTAVPKTTETIVVFDDTAAGENQPGWLFNRDGSTATPFAFDTEESSIGDGSLHVFPIANDYAGTPPGCSSGVGCDKFIAEYFALTEMGDIDSFSYDFNIGDGGAPSDANQFYLSVYANFAESGATKFYDCRYSVVPSTGSVGGWTTVTFDPSGSYSVATRGGSSPSPHACPSSPEDMGDDAIVRAFAINLGDTSVSDQDLDGYFDNVVFETSNKITTYDFDPEPTATVTMCKMKPDETPLDGWTLKLKGAHIQDVVVPANTPNGIDTSALVEGKSYLAEVAGVWLNDRNPDNHVDAEYSTEDVWETHMDGFTGYGNDILDLQIDNSFVDWGPYNSSHTYATSFIATSSNPVKFRAFDGEGGVPNASWYNDNSGSLNVSVYEGYAGVTDDGCVTFENVPYGTYTVDEVMQDGWVNVPELSTTTVTVDQDEVNITVVNTEEVAPMCSVTVVSDTSNTVVETEGNAVLTWAHTAWTAVIDGAEWIWGSEFVETPMVTEVQTFTKTFDWSGNVADASLEIATDNYYEVYLNGDFVASSTEDQLFKEENKDTIDVSAFVIAGENTLEIKVTNLGVPGSSATSNPAGLKYNLTVVSDEEGEDCMFAPEPGLDITDPATDHLVLADTHTFEAVYVDADNNDDPVLWAIRAGTCNAGTNTKAGNVDGFSDPYNWNGSKLSATVDMSTWDDGEYCFVVNPTEDGGTNFRETRLFTLENTAPTQCMIESSTSTVVVENNSYAVAAWTHNNWTDDIFGATWIWETELVEDPEATTTLTFKETFNATGITDASFEIASDNTYRVFINDVLRYERSNSNNYQTPDVYNDVLPFLQEGENELLVEVTNIGIEGTISKTNPAGALFKLEMEVGGVCEVTTDLSDEEEQAETYEVFGYVWNDEDEDKAIDGDESYRGGVAVSITNGTTTVATSTDTSGRYQFNVEAGNWTITADIGSDWDFTTPDNSGHSHAVSVSTSTGPYNFGTTEDSGTSGGGGGGGGNNNDDEEEGGTGGGNTTLDDETPSGPTPQVAGAFTGQGGGTGGSSDGEQGRVLGESTSTEEMATSTDEGSVVSKIMDKVFGDDGDEDDNCKYWWIFVIVWLIVSAVMYYFKGWGEGLISTLSTQLVFGILALLGLMSYFITGVACVIWPALIVGVGSAILLFINSNLRDDKVI